MQEENDVRAQVALRRPHARLRPRRPHDDAARGGALPARDAQLRRHRLPDLPAGRGGLRRREGDDRRRAVRALSRRAGVRAAQLAGACRRAASASRPARRWRPPTASRSRSTAAAATARIRMRRSTPCSSRATSSPRRSRSSPQREPDRHRGGQPLRDAGGQPGRDERDSRAREARRHGAHVPAGDAGHDRAAAHRARAVDRRRVRRDARRSSTSASIRRRSTIDREAMFAADVAEDAGRPRQRRAQPRPVDGLRGLLVHAAGEARRVRAARARAALEGGCFLHNSNYDFNDAVIPLGAGYLAALAETAMPLAEVDASTTTAECPRHR